MRLLDRLPGREEARVARHSLAPDEWEIDVASRDRTALLAHVAGVLVECGLDVSSAVIATWADGAALESFRVRRAGLEPPQLVPERLPVATPPDPGALEAAIVASFDRPLVAPPNPDAEVSFDDAGSPWYTLCEVRSPDRRGLLHTITAGIPAAGASVHSARLETIDGLAVDRFEVTDATGRKLASETKRCGRPSSMVSRSGDDGPAD